ncbi:MAG: restriction endonuclease subunit S, partial [Candidatus Electrothrix sp. AR5]|nr:restriction endonuclease subunit S [Candidatus Electrothrix sp. AR5]
MVAQRISGYFEYLKKSKQHYNYCLTLLISELGLNDWQPKHRLSFVKNYSETEQAKRLDAEHFQPKYDELIEAITTNSFYSKSISEIQTHNARGLQPKYAVDGELDVITSKHILEHDLNYNGFEKTYESNWKKQKKARVQKGDILTYTTGANIGRTACYSISKPALASNHVNILRIKNEDPEYVAFVMNSLIGRLQTERLSAGSAQAELYPRDIEKFLIPFTEEKIHHNPN